MFADAIDRASKFTKAIHLVTKHYGADDPTPGAGTLFFVNAEGWAITCKHVTDILLSVAPVNKRFQDFKTQRDLPVPKQHKKRVLKDLEKRFGYSKGSLEQLQAKFVDAVGTENGAVNFRVVAHQEVDLALIKFENAQQVICD